MLKQKQIILIFSFILFSCLPAAATSDTGIAVPSQSQALSQRTEAEKEAIREKIRRELVYHAHNDELSLLSGFYGHWGIGGVSDAHKTKEFATREFSFGEAIRTKSAACVKTWLDNGMNPNQIVSTPEAEYCNPCADLMPIPPLHLAILRSHKQEKKALPIIKLLLARGADPNVEAFVSARRECKLSGDYMPLEMATALHKTSIIKILLEAGANIHGHNTKRWLDLFDYASAIPFDARTGNTHLLPLDSLRLWHTMRTILHAGAVFHTSRITNLRKFFDYNQLQNALEHYAYLGGTPNKRAQWRVLLRAPALEINPTINLTAANIRPALQQPIGIPDLINIVIQYVGYIHPDMAAAIEAKARGEVPVLHYGEDDEKELEVMEEYTS